MEEKTDKKELAIYDSEYLNNNKGIGMSKVDPLDIRPPEIRLIQKSSAIDDFMDKNGKKPKIGQFFHTGKLEILDNFEAYILFAGKGIYTDKRKPEEGNKPQYKAIGALASDFSLFGLTLRSSALYTLSPLFTTTVSLKRPMFSIKIRFEVKELAGEKGTWYIPVCRILGAEESKDKLSILSQNAINIDKNTTNINLTEEKNEQIESIFNS